MVLFVDLDEEAEPPQMHHHFGLKPEWKDGGSLTATPAAAIVAPAAPDGRAAAAVEGEPSAADQRVRENPNRNGTTEALGCYPIIIAIASSLDLNSLDSLSRTCWQVRQGLLQYRSTLVTHTLHCENEDVPVDPEDTFRYRARAGNWYYMEDASRTGDYNGKSGSCARDMVAECRRCARIVCRNCAIKPPAPAALRNRHRRLCIPCTKVPLGTLVKPPLHPDTPIDAGEVQRAICTCASEAVWLCQPCGRSILGADQDYKAIWKWRNQYGEVLGGLGTGIGEGDRGVICGRESACASSKIREEETDCDAADARDLRSSPRPSVRSSPHPSPPSSLSGSPPLGSAIGINGLALDDERRTPSPQLRPGYARHEIEGIGGVVKTKLMRMVRVGACVPEWEDEKNKGEILGREVSGRSRSWCGWCLRVIPGVKDLDAKDKGEEDRRTR